MLCAPVEGDYVPMFPSEKFPCAFCPRQVWISAQSVHYLEVANAANDEKERVSICCGYCSKEKIAEIRATEKVRYGRGWLRK